MNHLPADDSHEISSLIYFFLVKKFCKCRLLQIVGGALLVKVEAIES